MKKYLWFGMMSMLLLFSCFDDESNMDIRTLNPIEIENLPEQTRYSLYMGDTLKIEPLVYCKGIPDADLSFEWKLYGGSIVPTVIDTTMYLCAQIVVPPIDWVGYTLRFTVTDRTTGIQRYETFGLDVLSPYGEGLLIADTRDGINSDLSLVVSKEVSGVLDAYDSKIKYFRNLWSQNNGAPLPGLVLTAATNNTQSNPSLTVLTTEHLLRASHQDFVNIPGESDGALWPIVPPHIGHGYTHGQFVYNESNQTQCLMANGILTSRGTRQGNRMFKYPVYPNGEIYNVTLMYKERDMDLYAYDALKERLLVENLRGNLFYPTDNPTAGSPFDIRDLSAYEPFYMNRLKSGVALLAKEKVTGAYKALIMNCGEDLRGNYAHKMEDFSAATGIGQARAFATNWKEDVIYYATETEVYTFPLTTGASEVQWKVEPGSGDKITGIEIYSGGGNRFHEDINNGNPRKVTWGSNGNMILISTYNEATQEGKVICVPIKVIGIGGMEQNRKYHVTFRGFGKILGVYKQCN